MKEVRIGLIGTGYIGKAQAIAYAQAPTVFNLRGKLVRTEDEMGLRIAQSPESVISRTRKENDSGVRVYQP